MSDRTASFTGNIPENYDRGLGPVFFADFAAAMARHVTALAPSRVLETSAGTGIVTRCLRDLLPAATQLTATDLNPPMLDVARAKFGAAEKIAFQPADATALPFPDQAFDFRVAVHRIEKLVADAAGFARGLIYGNPVFEQIRSRGAAPDEILKALAAALRREFGPEPYRIPLQAILFQATRP